MILFTDQSFEKLFESRIIGSKILSESKMIRITHTLADVYQQCKKFGFKGFESENLKTRLFVFESKKRKSIWIRDRFLFFFGICVQLATLFLL